MADPKVKKTLDQIVNDTLSSNFGISDADLQLLFEDPVAEPTTNPSPATATPTVEPVTPTPPAAEPTAPAVSTAVTEPVVSPPEPLTDKSRDLENSLKTANDQIAQLSTVVQELLRKSQATGTEPVKNQTDPLADIDDQAIIAAPKESIVKLVNTMLKQVLPTAFTEYDTIRNTREFMDRFKSAHSDFDELRPLMRQIVSENPSVNDNTAALPRVYDEAKRRKATALEAMKKELNIPATPAPTPVVTTPKLSEEEILAKLETRIVENIRKRRNASVPSTSTQTAPVSPTDRMAPREPGKPMTEDERMFDDMMKAGPNSAGFLHGLELASKK
jgi:hypothetical protein